MRALRASLLLIAVLGLVVAGVAVSAVAAEPSSSAASSTPVSAASSSGPATAEQAQSVLQALAPAETHVVVTARGCLWTLPGLWQEHVKFHSAAPLADFASKIDDDNPLNHWGWRDLDTAGVLARWGSTLPRERVHVITVAGKGAPRDLLWERYAALLGVDPKSCDASVATSNDSLGVVEVELLRKVNTYLGREYSKPVIAGRWLRTYLAAEVLAPRGGDRYGPDPEQEAFLRKKSVEIVQAIREAGYDVIGDLDELLPPDGAIDWRHPDEVTPAELADAGAATIARVLDDLRRVTDQRNHLRARRARRGRSKALAAAQRAQPVAPRGASDTWPGAGGTAGQAGPGRRCCGVAPARGDRRQPTHS